MRTALPALLLLAACDPSSTPAPPAENGTASLPSASAPPGLGEASEVAVRDADAAVTGVPPQADTHAIPAAFFGEWNMEPAACGTGLNDSRLVIEPARIRFYESVGEIERVAADGADRIAITARMSGEGETWRDSYRFRIDGPNRLVQEGPSGPPTVRQRCPAEPKGAPAHSATTE